MIPASRAHRRAVLMMIGAALCWSTGGILVRQVAIASAWEIVFWRSLAMSAFVAATLAVMHRRGAASAVAAVGRPGVLSGAFLAGTFFFYIASLTRTTVANTSVLMSVSPFLAALAGRLFLREQVPTRTWLAMAVAFAGIVAMFADSLDAGRVAGNLLALGIPCCFALNITMLRRFRAHADMLPTVMLAGVFSFVPAFFLAGPFTATLHDVAVLTFMGFLQLGTGCLLMTAASKQLSASEIGLLSLLETILGPLWVWALIGEHPGTAALTGGVVVLSAVVANELFALWRGDRATVPTPAPPRA